MAIPRWKRGIKAEPERKTTTSSNYSSSPSATPVSGSQKSKIDKRIKWADKQSDGAPSISYHKPVDTVTPRIIRKEKSSPLPTTDKKQSQYDYIISHGKQKDVGKLQSLEKTPPIGPSFQYTINPYHKKQSDAMQQQYGNVYESMSPDEKIEFTKRYARFGEEGDKTWHDVKKEEPALYLKYKDEQVVSELDTKRWRTEKYEGIDPVSAGVSKFSSGVMVSLDPSFHMSWITKGTGGVSQYMSDWEYGMRKDYGVGTKDVDLFGYYTGRGVLQSPGYMNVVYPFGGGAAFGAAFKGVSLAAKGATGIAGKALGGFASKAPWVAGGVMSGVIGSDIGYAFATDPEHSGKGMAKVMQYGMQVGAAGAGAKWGSSLVKKPVVKIPKVDTSSGTQDLARYHLGKRRFGTPKVRRGDPYARTGKPRTRTDTIDYAKAVHQTKQITAKKFKLTRPSLKRLFPKVFQKKLTARHGSFDPRSFKHKTPPGVEQTNPYSKEGLNELFKPGETTKMVVGKKPTIEIIKTKPTIEIIKPGTTTKMFSSSSIPDNYLPMDSGRTILLTKTKMIHTIPEVKTITPTAVRSSALTSGKMPALGFPKMRTGNIFGKIWGRSLTLDSLAAAEAGVYTSTHSQWLGVVPTFKNDIKQDTLISPISKSYIDSKYIQSLQQSSLLDSAKLSKSIKATETITTPITKKATRTIQGSKSILTPIIITDTVIDTVPKKDIRAKFITKTRKNIIPKYNITPIAPPFAYFDTPYINKNKKKLKKSDPFGSGYRFRKWKVPSMKQYFEWGL